MAVSPECFIIMRNGSLKFSGRHLGNRKQENKGCVLKFFCLEKSREKLDIVMLKRSDTTNLVLWAGARVHFLIVRA